MNYKNLCILGGMKNIIKIAVFSSILFCLLGAKQIWAQETSSTNFYFVQITDTHLGDPEHYRRTKLTIDEIKEIKREYKLKQKLFK